GPFMSTDSGASWTAINVGLTAQAARTLAINPDNPRIIYAGTGGHGIFDTRRQPGAVCLSGSDCPSGTCADGICCDAACTSTCASCASAKTGVANGTCAAVIVALQTSNGCNASGVACDGAESCRSATGQACSSSSDCATGNCVDGICCDVACT